MLVTVDPAAPHEALFDVRTTTLRVVRPSGPLRYLLLELPGSPGLLAGRLAAEPWCLTAETRDAARAGRRDPPPPGSLDVVVRDPVFGRLRYRLLTRASRRESTTAHPG